MTRQVAGAVFDDDAAADLKGADAQGSLGDEAGVGRVMFERPIQAPSLAEMFTRQLVAGVVLTDALIGTFAGAMDSVLRQNRCLLYHTIGRGDGAWLVPVGGMGASRALADAARGAGAELRLGAEVTAVEPGEGYVAVEVQDGRGRARISARPPAGNAAPAELVATARRTAPRPGAGGAQLKVNLLLSRLPRLRDRAVARGARSPGPFTSTSPTRNSSGPRAGGRAGRSPRRALRGLLPLADGSLDPRPGARARGADADAVRLHIPAGLFRADPAGAREAAL